MSARLRAFTGLTTAWCAVLAVAAGSPSAKPAAQDVPDPTRPPAALLRASSASGAMGLPTAARASAPVAAPLHLSSVRVSEGAWAGGTAQPSTALIDDRLVQVGDRLGDSTVAAIDRQGVSLRGPHGLRRLLLAPDVVKATVSNPDQLSLAGRKDR